MTQQEIAVRIPVGQVVVEGNLAIPSDSKGIVIFAHGIGHGMGIFGIDQ